MRGRTAGCRGGFAGRRAARAVSSDEHTTHSARSRASQFQETAKELRDAHTEFGGRLAAAKAGEDEVRFAFPGELNGGAEGGDERQAVDEAADDAADEASGGHVEEDAGDDAPGMVRRGVCAPSYRVRAAGSLEGEIAAKEARVFLPGCDQR